MPTNGNGTVNPNVVKKPVVVSPPPQHTDTVKEAMDVWHGINAANEALQNENHQLNGEVAVLRARVAWMEQHIVKLADELELYKAANVTITTEITTVASIFQNAIQRIRDTPYAPKPTLLPKIVPANAADEADDDGGAAALAAKLAPQGGDEETEQSAN